MSIRLLIIRHRFAAGMNETQALRSTSRILVRIRFEFCFQQAKLPKAEGNEIANHHSALMLTGPVKHQAGPAGLGWKFYQPSQNLFEASQVTEAGLPLLEVENRVPLAHDMGIPSSIFDLRPWGIAREV